MLKEVAPRVARAAVLRPSDIAAGPGQFGTIQALAPSLGVELRPVNVRDATEIERALTEFAQGSDGGLIVFGSPGATIHRSLIIALAAKYRLPAVYNSRFLQRPAVSSPTAPISSINTVARPTMWIAFLRARSRLTCRCKRRPSTSW